MAVNDQYWEQLISEGLRFLQEQNNDTAAAVLQKATFDVEHSYHDSWRWGTDYWALILYLKYIDYLAMGEKKGQIERDIMSALVAFQKESRDLLSTISIRPLTEQNNDWNAALPFQKAIEDADLFISEGNYDDTIERIHTAFSDYIKHIITEHEVYLETDAGDRIKTILLSTGEFRNTINELRNNNTAVHPDGQLIEKREAKLAVGLANSIVEYIEDVEKESS